MKMRLRIIIAFLCLLTPTLALANACTYSGTSGNFQAVAWVGCGASYPKAGDTATISGAGVVVTVPLGETDAIGTTGGTTPHPVLTVSGSAGLVVLGTLTVGNQSGVQTNDIKVTGSGSFILNRGTFNQQGDLDLDTSAEFDACAGGVHAVVSSGTTILNRITGTTNAVPFPLWNMHSSRCALYGGAIPSSPVGTPCTDAGGGASCYHMQVPAGTAFQWGHFGDYLVFDVNSLVFDSPNSTYGTCGKIGTECAHVNGFWCRNTTFNFTGEMTYATAVGSANDPGLDWSADAYGKGCDTRNPLSTGVGLYCSATTSPGTYDPGTGRHNSPRRIEWATFDVDAGEHNYGYISSLCPGLDINNVVTGAEFLGASGGSQINTNFHDMLFLRAYNFGDTFEAYFLPGAGLTYTNIGFLSQAPKASSAHSHMISEAPPAGANFGQNYTTCNVYKNLFFEGSGDTISHDNMMVNSTCIRYQGGIFDHNFTNFIDNNNSSAQCNSCNASGAEHVTMVDNNNSADPTSPGFEPWEVQLTNNHLGVNKVEEINSFLAQSATNVIGHSAASYINNTNVRWTEQPAYGSANITSVVVANPNMTINVDSSTPFQSSTHGQVQLISVLGTSIGGTNESPGNCTVGTILRINSGNNDATFQNTSTTGDGPISSYAIVAPGTGYTSNRYSVAYTTTVVSGGTCSTTPVVSVATGDVWARLGCTMKTGYGIQSTAATVLNCHHFFVTSTTSTSVTGAIPPGVTLADGTYTTTGIIEKGFDYDYNVGGDWQSRVACGTPNLWNTAAGGIDGIPFGDPNITGSCNWTSFGTFTAASTCSSPCTSLSANAVTGHPFAVNQVVIDRTAADTTTALITAVSGSGPYTLTLGPNNQNGTAGLNFTVATTDTLVLMQGIWDSTAPAFGTATHYGANDVSASPQLAYSSFTSGKITGITLTPPSGSGYTQGNVYFLSGGTDPAAITATTVVGGAITVATLIYGGSGYSSGQVLTVQGGGGDATVTTSGVQASCNLATWDNNLGGVGSWANAKKMLLAMNGHDQAGNTVTLNPEYNLQNFFAYKAECYKFYNTALNGKGAQGTDPGFAPNSVDPAIGKITDNYILPGATPTVNGAGENVFPNQAGQVHAGGHGQLTLASAPRICADALDPCTALTVSPVVLAGQYYHFTANGPAAITWSVSGDTNSSITPQTGVYTRTGTPTGTITVTATNLNGSSNITVSPSGAQALPVITSETITVTGVSITALTNTITRSAGSWITDGFLVGKPVTIAGFVNAGNNGNFAIQTVTATTITVFPPFLLTGTIQVMVDETLAGSATFTSYFPPSVPMGGTHQFTASGGAITWNVSGYDSTGTITTNPTLVGSINSSGVYTPPSGVLPSSSSRGWQLSTNNSAYAVRIDGLAKAPRSDFWTNTLVNFYSGIHGLNFDGIPYENYLVNVVNNSTPTYKVTATYKDVFNGTMQPSPLPLSGQLGQNIWYYNAGGDYHIWQLNKNTGVMYEQYQHYSDYTNPVFTAANPTQVSFTSARNIVDPPSTPDTVVITGGTGCWAAINSTGVKVHVQDTTHYLLPVDTSSCGTANAGIVMRSFATISEANNSQGADLFLPYQNYTGSGAGLVPAEYSATVVKSQELYNAVVKCRAASNCSTADMGHGLRLITSNYYFANYYVWPGLQTFGGQSSVQATCAWNATAGPSGTGATVCTTATDMSVYFKVCAGAAWSAGCNFGVTFFSQSPGGGGGDGKFSPVTNVANWTALNKCSAASYSPSCIYQGPSFNAQMIDKHSFYILHSDSTTVDSSTWGTSPSIAAHADFPPAGGMMRMAASFNNGLLGGTSPSFGLCGSGSPPPYCDYINVMLNTLKHWGFIYYDGVAGTPYNIGVGPTEFQTLEMATAAAQIKSYFSTNSFDTNIEFVDPTPLIVTPNQQLCAPAPYFCQNSMATIPNRITINAHNSFGDAYIDVIPQATVVGVYPEYLPMLAGTTGVTYQLNPWVSGNTNTGVTYFCCDPVNSTLPSIAGLWSVTSGGLITGPTASQVSTYLASSSNVIPQAILTISATGDANAKLRVLLDAWPLINGAVRMMSSGNTYGTSGQWLPTFNDGTNTWYGAQFSTSINTSSRALGTYNGVPYISYANGAGKNTPGYWKGCVPAPCSDPINLFVNPLNSNNTDIVYSMVLPNGQYRITMYHAPPTTVLANGQFGHAPFDWEVQGNRVVGYADQWAQTGMTGKAQSTANNDPTAAGFWTGFKMTAIANITNGLLTHTIRQRAAAAPGILPSAILIEPVSGSLAVQQAILPVGLVNIGYSSMVQAYGGTAPYTYCSPAPCTPSPAGSSLSNGLTLAMDGTVSGIPTTAGTLTFTVQATDNVAATATKSVTLTIVGPTAPASQTLDGVQLKGSKF